MFVYIVLNSAEGENSLFVSGFLMINVLNFENWSLLSLVKIKVSQVRKVWSHVSTDNRFRDHIFALLRLSFLCGPYYDMDKIVIRVVDIIGIFLL